jgi:methyl-accepting chemotaxis protein
MTLLRKLNLSLGAVAVLMALLSLFSIVKLRQLAQTTEALVLHPMAVSTGILAVDADVARVHRSMKDVAIAHSPQEVQAAADAADREEQQALERLQLVKQRYQGPPQALAGLEQAWAEWRAVRLRVVALSKGGQHDEATAITKAEGAQKVAAVNQAINAFRAGAERDAEAFYQDARATQAQTTWVLVGANLLAIAATVVLALRLSRGVARQLGGDPSQAADVARAVGAGDLGAAIRLRDGDGASLMAQLKGMQHNLVRVVTRVRHGSEGVLTASAEIAQGNSDLSQRTEQQASSLEQTAAAMEQLAAAVRQNAQGAQRANQLAQQASTVAAQGGQVVAQVVDTMRGINDSARRIHDIIGVIDGIAFQTNILALNAAVEAARAGEQGRGFAVVAAEVRSLAQRSSAAAREIKALISASVDRVEQGSTLVARAGETMTEVVASIGRVTGIMGEISSASAAQSADVAQVGQAVNQMDQSTQQNAALVEQMAAAAASLQQQAHQLVESVAVFKIGSAAPPATAAATPPSAPFAPRAPLPLPRWPRAARG